MPVALSAAPLKIRSPSRFGSTPRWSQWATYATTSSGASPPSIFAATFSESMRRSSLRMRSEPVTPSGTGSNPRPAACCFASSKSSPAISKSVSAVARRTQPSNFARPRLPSAATRSNDSA